jgi:hypothetical protein
MPQLKTLKIAELTHQELTKVKGSITARTGKDATYDEAILELIKLWKNQKELSQF